MTIDTSQMKSERAAVLTVEKENEKVPFDSEEEGGKRIFWKLIERDIFLTKY